MFNADEIEQEIWESTQPRGCTGSKRCRPSESNPIFWDEPKIENGRCDVVTFFERKRKNLTGFFHENE